MTDAALSQDQTMQDANAVPSDASTSSSRSNPRSYQDLTVQLPQEQQLPTLRLRTQLPPTQQQHQLQQHRGHVQAVEMSAVVSNLGRSSSLEALVHANINWDELSSSDSEEDSLFMSAAAAEAAARAAAASSSSSSNAWPTGPLAATPLAAALGSGGGSSSTTAGSSSGFGPFEVEEQATEVKYLREAYAKKDRECEHLRQIIKELSQSRSRVQKTKVELEEQYAALQKEYYRVSKVSDLARTVSQQAVARASTLKGELAAAQDQARRSRRRAAAADAKAAALADENARLRQRMALMESLRLGSSSEDFRTSACAREFLFSHSVSLY